MTQDATDLWTTWRQQHDERAFEALVRAELPHALGFARRLGCSEADAQDAIQDALVRLATLPDDAPAALGLRAWLLREVHARARSRLRSDRRRRAREAAVAGNGTCAPGEAIVVLRDEVDRALSELDEDERTAVELRFLHDLDYREMAVVLGASEGACRQRVHKARAKLRERLGPSAAALMAAPPLPAVRDVGAVVRRALRSSVASSAATATVGAIVMTVKMQVLGAAILVLVAAVATWRLVAPEAHPDAPHPSAAAVGTPGTEDRTGVRLRERARDAAELTSTAASRNAPGAPRGSAAERATWPVRIVTNVPGATVTLGYHYSTGDPDPPPESKVADAKGFAGFALPNRSDPVAGCTASARAAGYATASMDVALGDVRIDLEPGVAVRGLIADEAGRPVMNANVTGIGARMALSDADGAFEGFAATAGDVSYHVWHPDFLPEDGKATAPTNDVRVVLRRGLTISGRIAFPDLRPVPGVDVVDARGWLRATSDEDGGYVVSGLEPGSITLRCGLTGETRTVAAGATGADFVVTAPVARVRFVDEQRRPFRLASVWMRIVLDGTTILTSATNGGRRGYVLVHGTAGARLLISPTVPGYDELVTAATFGDEPRLEDVEVVIPRGGQKGAIRVRVRSDGAKLPGSLCVTVENEAGSSVDRWYGKRVELGDEGTIEIPNVMPGRVDVSVAAGPALYSGPDYCLPTRGSADVRAGRTSDVELTLPVGGRVRVTARDASGAPAAPARLDLLTESGERIPIVFVRFTDDGGWATDLTASPAELGTPVRPGRYIVAAKGSTGVVVREPVVIVGGATVDIDLTLRER